MTAVSPPPERLGIVGSGTIASVCSSASNSGISSA